MNDHLTIIRSAVGSTASPSSILLLKSLGVRVIGTDLHSNSAGARICDAFELVVQSKPGQNDIIVRDSYLEIVKKYNAKFILSGPENEVLILSKYRSEFEAAGCVVLHPVYEDLIDLVNKYNMHKRLENVIPQAAFCLSNHLSSTSLPLGKYVAKPIMGRGSAGVIKFTAKNAQDFNLVPREDYLIQQFLEGKEYSVDVLCDLNGKLLSSVIRTRSVVDSGISVVTETVIVPKILEYVESLILEFKLIGISCIQFIENNGEYYITDINPRLGGSGVLSFKASYTFLNNFRALLFYEELDYSNPFEYTELKMMRYLCEIYE